MLSIASVWVMRDRKDNDHEARTNDPVSTLKQDAAFFLPPNVYPSIHFYPPRNLFQGSFNTFHLWRAYVAQASSGMSV
jgi:hypothetical protein